MAEEELLADLWDPLVRTTGRAALGAAGVVAAYLKIKGNPLATKPVDSAVDKLLPQAYHRALLSAREGHRIILRTIEAATDIEATKTRLKQESATLTKEEKLSMWSEIMIQSYAVIIVTPHILTAMVTALTIRSAVSVLAHLHNSQQQGGGLPTGAAGGPMGGLMGMMGGSAMMAALSKMVGENAFALDDADDGLLVDGLVDPDREFFSKYDIIDILCARIPGMLHRARLCVMENIGMLPPTVSSVTGSSRGGGLRGGGGACSSSTSSVTNGTASSSRSKPFEDLHTLASKVPLDSLEAAIEASHHQFFEYILDWRADIYGNSELLFSELRNKMRLSAEPSNRSGRESSCQDEEEGSSEVAVPPTMVAATTNGHTPSSSTPSPLVTSTTLALASSSPAPPLSPEDGTRRRVRGFMQDLLTSPSVDELTRFLGANQTERWLDVCFFHQDTPFQRLQRQEDRMYQAYALEASTAAASAKTPAKSGWFGFGRQGDDTPTQVPFAETSPYLERLERIRKACTSFDLKSGGTVTLLQFVVSIDKARQELLAEPFELPTTDDNTTKVGSMTIPASLKEFCEELIRASAP